LAERCFDEQALLSAGAAVKRITNWNRMHSQLGEGQLRANPNCFVGHPISFFAIVDISDIGVGCYFFLCGFW
jgi:hypothetical protein